MSRRHGGTGLGLALTKRLAEAQGGRVGMRAASPGGSVFFAVLPRTPLEPVEPKALLRTLERESAPQTRGRPVLVLDDDSASLKLMQATLAKRGHEALCFSRATDALEALSRVHPIAVVVDLLMPGMDGFAFLDRFRSSPGNSRIPVMIWTVKDLSPEERGRLDETVQAVVQKGTGDDGVLLAVLNALLPSVAPLETKEAR
jgi:CheY-like chemotaxis protein